MSISSLIGQSVQGEWLQPVPWWSGAFEVTQGWGQTDFSGEPEGHGYVHWHAGADIGTPCGTLLTLPALITGATVSRVWNPGGYGNGLKLTIGQVDIWFGHLAQVLVPDGPVRGGTPLAITNNSGNSTGCHLHFEVRPAGQRYGSDIDPTPWVLDPVAAAASQGAAASADPGAQSAQLLGLSLDPFQGVAASIDQAEKQFVAGMVGAGQVLLGAGMMGGGLAAMVYGLRGRTLGAASSDIVRRARGVQRSRAAAAGRRDALAERRFQTETRGMNAEELAEYRRTGEAKIPESVLKRQRRPLHLDRERGPSVEHQRAAEVLKAERVRASRVKGPTVAPGAARRPRRPPAGRQLPLRLQGVKRRPPPLRAATGEVIPF